MRYIIRTIFLVIICRYCNVEAKIFQSRAHSIINKVVGILEECFSDRLNPLIIQQGPEDESFDPSAAHLASVVLIDSNFQSTASHQFLPTLRTAILKGNSTDGLNTTLQKLKASSWWDVDGLFFIVGHARGCESAWKMLIISWQINLLSVFFICTQDDERITLYTLNPFANRAPNAWEVVRHGENYSAGTLLRQVYEKSEKFCESLKFDKTKYLDGYKITAVANTKPGVSWIPNKAYTVDSMIKKALFHDEVFSKTLIHALNVSATIYYDEPGYMKYGQAIGFLNKLINGTYDIALTRRNLYANVSVAYPLLQSEMRILTQKRNFLLPRKKIVDMYSCKVVYLWIALIILTLIIVIINQKRGFTAGLLDILRLILSAKMLLPLKANSTRIYICTMILLIFVLNATFQGYLSAILTKPERHNIDSVDDLVKYQYHAYIPTLYEEMLIDNFSHIPKEHIHFVSDYDCFQYVVNDSSAACLQIIDRLLPPTQTYGLHISQDVVLRIYLSYWHRHDWPLRNKVNIVSAKLMSAGIFKKWQDSGVDDPWRNLKHQEIRDTAMKYSPTKLEELEFAFEFLGIGLGMSVIMFVIEMICFKVLALF